MRNIALRGKLHDLGNALQEVSALLYMAEMKRKMENIKEAESCNWKCCCIFKQIVSLIDDENSSQEPKDRVDK